jgi:PAS domain-containing protein
LTLDPAERAQIPLSKDGEPRVFAFGQDRWEGVKPIIPAPICAALLGGDGSRLGRRGVEFHSAQHGDLRGHLDRGSSALAGAADGPSISRPLAILRRGTRALMNSPEDERQLSAAGSVHNEIGDLIEAFNRMVASIAEQRSGLNDTLSLLDSMLANAPIGLAFFDRRCRFVRVNQVFADMTGREPEPAPGAHAAGTAAAALWRRNWKTRCCGFLPRKSRCATWS